MRVYRFRVFSVVLLFLAFVFLPSASMAEPIRASMDLIARVWTRSYITGHITMKTSKSSDEWDLYETGGIIPALSIAVSNSMKDKSIRPSLKVKAEGQGVANWDADGNSGGVTFKKVGWTMSVYDGSCLADFSAGMTPSWYYTFVADRDGEFVFQYSAIGSGDTYGLCGWEFLWSGPEGDDGSFTDCYGDPTKSGTIIRHVIARQEYTVGLWTNANLLRGAGQLVNTVDGQMLGDFSWYITFSK